MITVCYLNFVVLLIRPTLSFVNECSLKLSFDVGTTDNVNEQWLCGGWVTNGTHHNDNDRLWAVLCGCAHLSAFVVVVNEAKAVNSNSRYSNKNQ